MFFRQKLYLAGAICMWALVGIVEGAPRPPNVLLIVVDDLRPELACYGAEQIHSPHIDALARSGVRLTRAYCQQAVCNPSRTSFLTGKRPDVLGVTSNHVHFRKQYPDLVTLPQYFKQHGYYAAAIGKIYHGVFPDGASKTKWDTMGDPTSWSVPAVRFGPRYYYTEAGIAAAQAAYRRSYRPQAENPDDWTHKLVFGLATEAPDVPDQVLYDGQVAEAAVKSLQDLRDQERPFFLAVGFIKPHSPYVAPKKYFDYYPEVTLSNATGLPDASPRFAGHGSGELRRYTDQPSRGKISVENQRRVRQAYYACVSFIDAQVGRVLQALEDTDQADNTIVMLVGDHGYHLGEQGLWGKTTNFELDTRVPLLVRAPGMQAAGRSSDSLVELVDLYPTLVELAGLPTAADLDGKSFAPLVDDPQQATKPFALSQFPRGDGLMGYSLRSATHRLTQWVHRASGEIRATELYDYTQGEIETVNIANRMHRLVADLTTHLVTAFAASFVSAPAPTLPPKAAEEDELVTGFEQEEAGPFAELETSIGKWQSIEGKSLIDNQHAKSGRQCLQLTGGERTRVELTLAEEPPPGAMLRFWAERWTRRQPFSFRVEQHTQDRWREIYRGDQEVRVGRAFLSEVRIPLGSDSGKRLRFTVTSPPNTGILIDDLRVVPARPQKIRRAEVIPLALPALLGKEINPLLRLRLETSGTLDPISVNSLQVKLSQNTVESDVTSVQVFHNPGASGKEFGQRLGEQNAVTKGTPLKFTFEPGKLVLAEGDNDIWLTATLAPEANIDHLVGLVCQQIELSNGQTIQLDHASSTQRLGVAVRQGGDAGVHTYRIPGLATTKRGTLIGVYDVRRRSGGDLPGDIDVGMSRSTDGGRSWEPMRVMMDMGDDPNWRYDGCGDPAILVDRTTGTIWVAATWSHGNRSWRGSGPGMTPDETGQLMLVRSDDDGVSWSKPINITAQIKRPEWCFVLQGPGKGITMRDGTIVFAAQYQDPVAQRRLPHSTIIYSRDHGETWKVGTGAFDDTTEAQVIEVEPGVLMLNCRFNRKPVRVVMTTRDMGQTWQRHPTSERSLIEPGACMASLVDVDQELGVDVGGWLLFSNPDSDRGRHHLTIKASHDGGQTWPQGHRLLLDERTGGGYSCMSLIDQETVGILYEGSQAHMTFQRIPLATLFESTAVPEQPPSPDLQSPKQSLRLPRVFGDQMVLQADREIPMWGHARPHSQVTVTMGDESRTTTSNAQGAWQVRLAARRATPQGSTLTIVSAEERITLTDVVVGEVWVCAGQSNMEWPLRLSTGGREAMAAADRGQLRLLHLAPAASGSSGSYQPEHLSQLHPKRFCQGAWSVATQQNAANFSAVAWYFGEALQSALDVPVGLICPAVGGTPTESWIPREALMAEPDFREMAVGNWLDNPRLSAFCRQRGEQNLLRAMQAGEALDGDALGPNHAFKPGFMWSAGIEPLVPFGIRGVIWYQGESNAESFMRAKEHEKLFSVLVQQWRSHWKQGAFPFLFVQLPGMNRPDWPTFREGQRKLLDQLPASGMAVTIDTGHATNVHPPEKKTVGHRLARWALGTTYRHPEFATYSGPLLNSVKRGGDTIVVTFDHVGERLQSSDRQPLRHFEVCGADGRFVPAEANFVDRQSVSVRSPEVPHPQHVRYGWQPYPQPSVNLVNSAGLPASPFSSLPEQPLGSPDAKQAATMDPKRPSSSDAQGSDPQERPNILLIVGEDHGCELSCYGDPVIHTPHLDGLAAAGVLFENAYVTQSVCSPSRSTLFTGLYPHQNGQLGLATHQYRWFRSWPTSYSLLRQAGYRTGLIGKTHVLPVEAVESFVDFRFQPKSNFAKRRVADYASEAERFMRTSDSPFFLTVNYPDAHWPLQGKVDGLPVEQVDPQRVRVMPYVGGTNARLLQIVRNYYDCMLRLDACVGQLLQALEDTGKANNTLVIFLADHGAQMARGKVTVYEGGVRVPWLVRWPGVTKTQHRSRALVSTIDLLPTLLDAAGVTVPPGLPGKSLRAVLSDASEPWRDFVVCERNCDAAQHTFPQRTIRDARFKLIYSPVRGREDPAARYYRDHGAVHWSGCLTDAELVNATPLTQAGYARWLHPPEYQLYDLEKDPQEWHDLANNPDYMPMRKRLVAALQSWQAKTDDPLRDPEKLQHLLDENKAVVRARRRSPVGGWKYLEYLLPAAAASSATATTDEIAK